jgi:SAM-dependent methyltransferase
MDNNQTECLLCGKSADLRHDKFPGYQEPDNFKIYHCPACNTSFSLPDADTSVIYENIYKNGNKVPGYNRYWRYVRFIKKFSNPFDYLAGTSEAYWGVKEALSFREKNKDTMKILEVGSGLGYFTYSLIRADYDAVGLDISQTAVDQAIKTFGDHYFCAVLFEFARLNPETFDIVILTEVIEHIKRPIDFIESILKLLKPGGEAVITSPNKSLYPDDIIWSTDLPPVHCWWFSEESMKYIAKSLNADVSFVNFSNYYKNNYKVIGLKSHRDGHLPDPYFNKNGELINRAARSKYDLKTYVQLYLTRTVLTSIIYSKTKQYITKILGRSRELFEKDLIVCKEKGNIFCAVIKKTA